MATDRNKAIGQAIQQLRVAAGLSQIELATKLNELGETFHQQTVVKVENGTRPMKFTEAMSMAEALGVSIDMFTKSVPEIDATASGQRTITALTEAHKKVYDAARAVQLERIALAEWLLNHSEGADAGTIALAKFALAEDVAEHCRTFMEDVLAETFGTLPGEDPDQEMLNLLGWPVGRTDDDAET